MKRGATTSLRHPRALAAGAVVCAVAILAPASLAARAAMRPDPPPATAPSVLAPDAPGVVPAEPAGRPAARPAHDEREAPTDVSKPPPLREQPVRAESAPPAAPLPLPVERSSAAEAPASVQGAAAGKDATPSPPAPERQRPADAPVEQASDRHVPAPARFDRKRPADAPVDHAPVRYFPAPARFDPSSWPAVDLAVRAPAQALRPAPRPADVLLLLAGGTLLALAFGAAVVSARLRGEIARAAS